MIPFVVFVGAGLGGVARYAIGGWVQQSAGSGFPWGTLAINVSGSLALTFLYALLEGTSVPAHWRAFVGIGILGGYTTFSTFSYEAVRLMEEAQWNRATAYVLATVVGCLGAAVLGFRAGATILTRG